MNKAFLICLIFIFQTRLMAQQEGGEQTPNVDPSSEVSSDNGAKLKKPLGRVKSTTGVNSESSSFIGDPDNIDPLNPNRESLKEDDEPVLEDIRQVLDAPKKKKIEKKTTDPGASGAVTQTPTDAVASEQEVQASEAQGETLKSDDPDLILEKKFNRIYQRYNVNPTPDDVWGAATAKQTLREYVVQKGDTLWSISKILFGDSNFWPKIWALNNEGIHNPHIIVPNSKIYFHMGDAETAPSLSVGEPNVKPLPGAEAAQTDIVKKEKTVKSDKPTKIPESFPLYRNERYFEDEKPGEIKIELGAPPRFDYEVSNDIYIADKPIKTEVQVKISETAKFRCYEGRIIKDIRYNGKLVEDYDVFEPLSSFKTEVGVMYAYRAYAKANPYQKRNLKITGCKGLLTTDLVIIAKDKIQVLRNKQISPVKKAVLIGGPDVVDQKVFAPNQVAYVDFGSQAYEPGQEYNIMSQITDEINGHIKIIEKYGSFAVVVLTEVNDIVSVGDKVILN